jgi:hypothetical protein
MKIAGGGVDAGREVILTVQEKAKRLLKPKRR